MVPTGDEPINLEEPIFTHGEAVQVTGIPSKTLNNWTQREVVTLGMMHRTGRRLYSIADLIELKVIQELTTMVVMSPAHASSLAQYARRRALEISERGPDGRLLYRGMANERRKYLVAWFDGQNHKADVVYLDDFFGNHSIPHAVIVLPLDDIVLRVEKTAFAMLENENES